MNEGISSGDARSYFPQIRNGQQQLPAQQTNAEYVRILPAGGAANLTINELEILRLYQKAYRDHCTTIRLNRKPLICCDLSSTRRRQGVYYMLGDLNIICVPYEVGISSKSSGGRCRTCFKLLVDHSLVLEKPMPITFNCPNQCAFDSNDGLHQPHPGKVRSFISILLCNTKTALSHALMHT
jgi:hypothetical protein